MFFSSSPLSHTASHSIMNSKVAFAPADHLAAAALQSSDEEATFGCCWSNLPCALRRRRRRRTKKMRPTCVFYLQEGGREVAVPLESAPLDDRVVSDVLHDEPRSSGTLVPVVSAPQDLDTVVLDASQIASAIYTGCDEAKVVGENSSDVCDERSPETLLSLVCASGDARKVVLDASQITPTIYTGSDEATAVGENYSNIFSVSQCKSLNSVASGQTVFYAGHDEAKSLPDQNYSSIYIIVSDISPGSDKMADMMVASNSIQSSLPCSVREMPLGETFQFAVHEICKELRNHDSDINASVPRRTTPAPLPPVESDCISISQDTLPESDDNSDNYISIEKDELISADFAVNLGTSTDRPAKPIIEDRPSSPHPSAHESGTGEHHKVTVKDEKGLSLILPPRTDNEGSVVSASEAISYDTVHAVAQQELLTTSQANEPNALAELEQMCLSQPIYPNTYRTVGDNVNESPRENYPQKEASLPELLDTIASAQQILEKTVAAVDEDTADSAHSSTAELKEKSFSKPIYPNMHKTVLDNANGSPQKEVSLPEALDAIAAAQQVLENPAAAGNEQKADSAHPLLVDLQDMSFGEPAEQNAQEAVSESEDEDFADSSDSSTSSDDASCDVPASQKKKKKKGMSFLTFLFSKKKMKRNKILTFFVTMLLPIWLICFIVVPQASLSGSGNHAHSCCDISHTDILYPMATYDANYPLVLGRMRNPTFVNNMSKELQEYVLPNGWLESSLESDEPQLHSVVVQDKVEGAPNLSYAAPDLHRLHTQVMYIVPRKSIRKTDHCDRVFEISLGNVPRKQQTFGGTLVFEVTLDDVCSAVSLFLQSPVLLPINEFSLQEDQCPVMLAVPSIDSGQFCLPSRVEKGEHNCNETVPNERNYISLNVSEENEFCESGVFLITPDKDSQEKQRREQCSVVNKYDLPRTYPGLVYPFRVTVGIEHGTETPPRCFCEQKQDPLQTFLCAFLGAMLWALYLSTHPNTECTFPPFERSPEEEYEPIENILKMKKEAYRAHLWALGLQKSRELASAPHPSRHNRALSFTTQTDGEEIGRYCRELIERAPRESHFKVIAWLKRDRVLPRPARRCKMTQFVSSSKNNDKFLQQAETDVAETREMPEPLKSCLKGPASKPRNLRVKFTLPAEKDLRDEPLTLTQSLGTSDGPLEDRGFQDMRVPAPGDKEEAAVVDRGTRRRGYRRVHRKTKRKKAETILPAAESETQHHDQLSHTR